jgi:hypothetical protein
MSHKKKKERKKEEGDKTEKEGRKEGKEERKKNKFGCRQLSTLSFAECSAHLG